MSTLQSDAPADLERRLREALAYRARSTPVGRERLPEPRSMPPSRPAGRWLLTAAAVLLPVVLLAGAVLLLGRDDEPRQVVPGAPVEEGLPRYLVEGVGVLDVWPVSGAGLSLPEGTGVQLFSPLDDDPSGPMAWVFREADGEDFAFADFGIDEGSAGRIQLPESEGVLDERDRGGWALGVPDAGEAGIVVLASGLTREEVVELAAGVHVTHDGQIGVSSIPDGTALGGRFDIGEDRGDGTSVVLDVAPPGTAEIVVVPGDAADYEAMLAEVAAAVGGLDAVDADSLDDHPEARVGALGADRWRVLWRPDDRSIASLTVSGDQELLERMLDGLYLADEARFLAETGGEVGDGQWQPPSTMVTMVPGTVPPGGVGPVTTAAG